jgi:hypothetical protein
MPSAYNLHREFDYSALSSKSHHKAGRVFVFIVFGSIAAASGLALQMQSEEIDTERASVIAAASPSPGPTRLGIASPAHPAASVPNSGQESASPPNSAQGLPVDATIPSPTKPAPTTIVAPPPAQSAAEAMEPAGPPVEAMVLATTALATPAATETPQQPVAGTNKPKKSSVAKKPKKTPRQNRWEQNWYHAYAWGQPNRFSWGGRGFYHNHARPFW